MFSYVRIFSLDNKNSTIDTRIPQMKFNDGYSTFKLFSTFLENSEVVLRIQDTIFLYRATLLDDVSADPTISDYISLPSSTNQKIKYKTIHNIG